ncbi:cholinesterase 1-like [Diadema antillarum]|uniref:cholinesterase 1-like n=1 Tax=Diadema antillarum TaxID=105358 RepID=UPI003A83D867
MAPQPSVSLVLTVLLGADFFSPLLADIDTAQTSVVETPTITYRGKFIDVTSNQLPDVASRVAAYTGIPYAEPPTGELRFKRPVAKVIKGEFDATGGSNACAQPLYPGFDMSALEISEDCLYVDVFVPEPKPRSAAVMVFIHGGGFIAGVRSQPTMLPIPLAAMNDVIVVTLSYRLNVFGFLDTGDDKIPGNLGLLDQRQALIWVRDNIADFGGDPARVTIFGESAGSASVNYHVLSPMSAGLFSRGIMQSGAAPAPWAEMTAEVAKEVAFGLAAAMNCSATTTDEVLTCLKETPASDITDFFLQDPAAAALMPRPTVDGHFLPRSPVDMAADGEFNQVDIIIGCLTEEGNLFVSPFILGQQDSEKPVMDRTTAQGALNGHMSLIKDGVNQVVLDMTTFAYTSEAQLADPENNYLDVVAGYVGDSYFFCPTYTMTEHLSAGDNTVYQYFMSHAPSRSMFDKDVTWLGPTHAEDIPYVFGYPLMADQPDDNEMGRTKFTDDEALMSVQIMKYFSNFAKTGNPNLSSNENESEIDSTYPPWLRFSKDQPVYKNISLTFSNGLGHPRAEICYFHQNILSKLHADSAEMIRMKTLLEETKSP